jgi:hypothetical protein
MRIKNIIKNQNWEEEKIEIIIGRIGRFDRNI